MSKAFPVLKFKTSRRQVPPTTKKWLVEKTLYLEGVWQEKGPKIMREIEKQCGFGFPAKTISKGIVVHVHKRGKDENPGDMEETKPFQFNLYVAKSETWRDVKGVMVHELLHCLMWQKFYFDYRVGKPTFFADIFADELVTSVVECMVLGRKPGKKTCGKAVDYALEEAIDRLSRTDRREKLVEALVGFFAEYPFRIRRKGSNVLKEREKVMNCLPSLLPEAIDV
jgi:hypothetical protein